MTSVATVEPSQWCYFDLQNPSDLIRLQESVRVFAQKIRSDYKGLRMNDQAEHFINYVQKNPMSYETIAAVWAELRTPRTYDTEGNKLLHEIKRRLRQFLPNPVAVLGLSTPEAELVEELQDTIAYLKDHSNQQVNQCHRDLAILAEQMKDQLKTFKQVRDKHRSSESPKPEPEQQLEVNDEIRINRKSFTKPSTKEVVRSILRSMSTSTKNGQAPDLRQHPAFRSGDVVDGSLIRSATAAEVAAQGQRRVTFTVPANRLSAPARLTTFETVPDTDMHQSE